MMASFIFRPRIKSEGTFRSTRAHNRVWLRVSTILHLQDWQQVADTLAGPNAMGRGWPARQKSIHKHCPCANASPCIDLRCPEGSSLHFCWLVAAELGRSVCPPHLRNLMPHTLSHPFPNRRPPSKHTPACPGGRGPASKTERP